MTIESEADRIFPTLLERCEALRDEHGPAVVPISIYESDNDLHTLNPTTNPADNWPSAAFHRSVMERVAMRLQLHGHRAILVPLDAARYLRWLASEKLKNTAENRASFIGVVTQENLLK